MSETNNELKLLQEKNRELTQRVIELENLVRNVSVPIIPSIVPDTILIPIAGELSLTRFDLIIPRILEHANSEETDTAILDFTAISLIETEKLDILGEYLRTLTTSLNLMGVQVLVVGIAPQFAQELVGSRLPLIKELNTFSTFKSALQYLMKEKGLSFAKK